MTEEIKGVIADLRAVADRLETMDFPEDYRLVLLVDDPASEDTSSTTLGEGRVKPYFAHHLAGLVAFMLTGVAPESWECTPNGEGEAP